MNTRTTWLLAGALSAGLTFSSLAGQATEPIRLMVKSEQTIEVPDGLKRIHNSDPTVLNAYPTKKGRALRVIGLKPGTVEVRLSRLTKEDVVYRFEVGEPLERPEPTAVERGRSTQAEPGMELELETVEMKVEGSRVTLTGWLNRSSDHDRARDIAERVSDDEAIKLTIRPR